MFQRGEKLCSIPTEGLQEEKHSDYVSMMGSDDDDDACLVTVQPMVPLYIKTLDSLHFFCPGYVSFINQCSIEWLF